MRLIKVVMLLLLAVQFCVAKFDPCKFNFGRAWDGGDKDYSEVDYITIWAGSDENWNGNWIGAMLSKCKSDNKTPVLYSYIIAFTARRDMGLKDCDVGTPNLCQQGAKYIRENKSRITGQYEKYASGVKNSFGTTDPVIWLMEPDFFQYVSSAQEGTTELSSQEAGQLMKELVAIIKRNLPNAVISMDISPWNTNQSGWFSSFTMSDFTYMNTSGGRTDANSTKIRNENGTTWSSIHSVTGKCIIADDGYGVGGGSIGHDPTWDDVNNLNARIADGVIAITQASPKADWASTIRTIRPQLNRPICPCSGSPTKPKYTLSTSVNGSGTISVSPQGTSFDSGTTVTLTANPSSGATFTGWGGAVSGTSRTVTLLMNSNKTVSASFGTATKPKYTLSTSVNGSGSISVSPQGTSFDSGTTVTLTANPSSGATFTGWGGAVSGTSQTVTLLMNSNKTVSASFSTATKPRYTLTINTSGSGTVSINPQGTSFDSGSTVTLTAAPSEGATFTGWSGAASGTSSTVSILMNSNKEVSAVFTNSQNPGYTLVIDTEGLGSVTVSPQAQTYAPGTEVTLTAEPLAGAAFSGWSGALSGSTNPATLVMNADASVVARFIGTGGNTEEMISNGTFSTGNTGWNIEVYGGRAEGSVVSGEYFVNTSEAGSEAWNIQLTQTGLSLQQGTTYTVSFQARASSPTTVVFNVGMSGTPYTSYSQERTVELTSQMQTYAFTFTMTAATDTDARIEFNSGLSSIPWYLDNVSLTESGGVEVKRDHLTKMKPVLFDFESTERVSLTLYDQRGRVVVQKIGKAGSISAELSSLRAGTYIAVLSSDRKNLVRRFVNVNKHCR